MNQKTIYRLSLVGFFYVWGVFGFVAAAPGGEPGRQATLPPAETPVIPEATTAVGIPVTAEPEPVWTEIVVFYGLIGITAMFLIFALLSFANKSTTPHAERKRPSPKNGQQH